MVSPPFLSYDRGSQQLDFPFGSFEIAKRKEKTKR